MSTFHQRKSDIPFLEILQDMLFVCVRMCVSVCLYVLYVCVIREEADEEASDILTDRWRLIQLIYYPRGECHSEIGLH